MDYGLRVMKIDGNVKSRARTKKEPLVRWIAMPNVVTKESPDTQWAGYGLRATTTDDEAETHARQVLAHSRRAMV